MTIKIDGKPLYTKDNDVMALLANVTEHFMKTIIEQEEVRPLVHVHHGGGINVYMTNWSNDREKIKFSNFLLSECKKLSAEYLIFASDIWMTKKIVSNNSKINLNDYLPPSKDPNRTEALLITVMYPNGDIDSIHAPYIRSILNQPIFNTNPYWGKGQGTMSLFKPWIKVYN